MAKHNGRQAKIKDDFGTYSVIFCSNSKRFQRLYQDGFWNWLLAGASQQVAHHG